MGFIARIFNEFKRLNNRYKTIIVIFVLLGSFIRLSDLFHFGFYFDTITTQYTWAVDSWNMGLVDFWRDYDKYFDYLPFSVIFLNFIYAVSMPFGASDVAFIAVLKIFFWIVDILVALFIIRVNKKVGTIPNRKAHFLAAGIYFLPSIWFVSGTWGQMDTLIVFLSMIAIYLLYFGKDFRLSNLIIKKEFVSGFVWFLAVMIKLQAILLLPMLFVHFLQNRNLRSLANHLIWIMPFLLAVVFVVFNYLPYDFTKGAITPELKSQSQYLGQIVSIIILALNVAFAGLYIIFKKKEYLFLLGSTLVFALATIPFLIINTERMANVGIYTLTGSFEVSTSGATFWKAIGLGGFNFVDFTIIGLDLQILSYILFITLFVVIISKYVRWRNILSLKKSFIKTFSFSDFVVSTALVTSSYYIFALGRIHSRYLHFGALFFLLSLVTINKNLKDRRIWFGLIILLQFTYFLNNLDVFVFFYDNPFWAKGVIHSLELAGIDDVTRVAGVLNTLIFLPLLIWYIIRYPKPTI